MKNAKNGTSATKNGISVMTDTYVFVANVPFFVYLCLNCYLLATPN